MKIDVERFETEIYDKAQIKDLIIIEEEVEILKKSARLGALFLNEVLRILLPKADESKIGT
jgi:hypothetical protein